MRINIYYYLSIVIMHRKSLKNYVNYSPSAESKIFQRKKAWNFQGPTGIYSHCASVLVRSCAARFIERDTKEFSSTLGTSEQIWFGVSVKAEHSVCAAIWGGIKQAVLPEGDICMFLTVYVTQLLYLTLCKLWLIEVIKQLFQMLNIQYTKLTSVDL